MDTIGLFDYLVKDVGGPRDLSHFLGTAFLGRHLLETANLGLDIQLMGDKKLVEERSSGARQNWEKRSMGVPEVEHQHYNFTFLSFNLTIPGCGHQQPLQLCGEGRGWSQGPLSLLGDYYLWPRQPADGGEEAGGGEE